MASKDFEMRREIERAQKIPESLSFQAVAYHKARHPHANILNGFRDWARD